MYDDALNAVKENEKKKEALKSAEKEIIKRIGDGTEIDVEKEEENKRQVEKEREELRKKLESVLIRVNDNKRSLSKISEKLIQIKSVEEKWTWMQALSDTANGDLKGKEKVMLETYI